MQTHPQSAEVQEQACGAPCNLAVDDEIGMRIASAGGIEAVVKAMQTHARNEAIQKYGCRALAMCRECSW